MKRRTSQTPSDVAALTAILREREDFLLKIPGVTGSGVGLARHGKGERIVIQVFVEPKALDSQVQERVRELFRGYPVETIAMSIPNAE